MSTTSQGNIKLDDLQESVNNLLTDLEGMGEISLKKSHTSVLFSFEQMLAYTDKISTLGMPPEIKLLLDTYQNMAKKFYTQYETTLLEKIKEQRKLIDKADTELLQIQKMLNRIATQEVNVTEATKTVVDLLDRKGRQAKAEYETLIKDFPNLMQKALDMLREEWQRLNTIALASKTINRDEKLIQALDTVVEAARFSVGIKVDRISVVPGDVFALQFYSYLKDFAVLTVPIYSVQAPWEWSIFWHELAGDIVRSLDKNAIDEIDSIRKNLKFFYKKCEDQDAKKRALKFVARNNYTRNYLDKLFSAGRLILRDLGDFEHQFERMIDNLHPEDKFQMYEQVKLKGWCVNWLKELFEDAWSLIVIREPFREFFENVLNRMAVKDERHPTVEIRLAVADEILRLMNINETEVADPKDEIESAAQQILNFISLLMAASMTWLFDISQDPADRSYWKAYRPLLSDRVGQEIGVYLKKWSDGLTANIASEETQKYAGEFINSLADGELSKFIETLTNPTEQQLSTIEPSYDDLLTDEDGNPRKYEELQRISFYDVDFLAVTIYTIGIKGQSFSYSGALPVDTIGTVAYTVNGANHTTNPSTWNEFFGKKFKI